jgi:hypothetical protein
VIKARFTTTEKDSDNVGDVLHRMKRDIAVFLAFSFLTALALLAFVLGLLLVVLLLIFGVAWIVGRTSWRKVGSRQDRAWRATIQGTEYAELDPLQATGGPGDWQALKRDRDRGTVPQDN